MVAARVPPPARVTALRGRGGQERRRGEAARRGGEGKVILRDTTLARRTPPTVVPTTAHCAARHGCVPTRIATARGHLPRPPATRRRTLTAGGAPSRRRRRPAARASRLAPPRIRVVSRFASFRVVWRPRPRGCAPPARGARMRPRQPTRPQQRARQRACGHLRRAPCRCSSCSLGPAAPVASHRRRASSLLWR